MPFSEYLSKLDLNHLLAVIPCGLFIVDQDRTIKVWNKEAEHLTGYTAAEALGKSCALLLSDHCTRKCGLFDPATPKPVRGATCSLLHKSGETIHISKNVDLIRDDQGNIVGGIESFVDISTRVQLENQLAQTNEKLEETVALRTAELEKERLRLQSVLDAMADLAYVISPEMTLEMMNRSATGTFGQHTGSHCYKALYQQNAPCPNCPMPRVAAGETITEERSLSVNGRTYEIIHTPFPSADGTNHKLSIFRDITARKQIEEQLRQANAELDAFTYTVSHDLRSPLTPIIGFAEFLQEEYREQLDDQGVELLQEIESQGQRMLTLLEDLLQLSRVGHIESGSVPVDPMPLIHAVLNDLAEEIRAGGTRIVLNDPGLLPIPETAATQLFANLLTNALRYAGGPDKVIELGPLSREGFCGFFIKDHGPGIPETEKEKVFDPFYRGAASQGTTGTGIGLAIVRKLARIHNGTCLLEDTPGGGLTITLSFPQPHQEAC